MSNYKKRFQPLLVKKRCIRKEHEGFNASAQNYGHDVATLDRYTDRAIQTTRKVFAFLGKPVGITQEMVDLTATTALEHFTATIASQLLVNNHIQELMSDETMKTMWLWHAIEENEHKAVAYDVFEGVFGKGVKSYLLRNTDRWLQPWPFYSACSRILCFGY